MPTFLKRGRRKEPAQAQEGDLYATDGIAYHIPDERLWMQSKIVFYFGQEGGGEQLGSSC